MKPINKIAGINLAVLLIYSLLIRLANRGNANDGALGIMIMSAFVIGFHVVICLIVAAVTYGGKHGESAKAWLLSSGIVLLVGFSTCLGNANLK